MTPFTSLMGTAEPAPAWSHYLVWLFLLGMCFVLVRR
jgi:hypothetical protein